MAVDHVRAVLVRQLVAELGVRASDIQSPAPIPTVDQYVPRMIAAASPACLRAYGAHWHRAAVLFAGQGLDDLQPSDILALQHHVVPLAAGSPQATRGGRTAGQSRLRAMRALYRLAETDGLIRPANNPAAQVPIPRRLPSPRRALLNHELAAILQVVLTTGNDVPLDSLLIRLHMETACRRGGALGLRLRDLDIQSCALRLREKGGTVRWQPITPILASALDVHARIRGAHEPADTLLRYSNRRPLNARRYDVLWGRVRRALPWVDKLGVSTHWLRHTTITWVERNFGYAVARAYAGHTDSRSGSTVTYIKGHAVEVATALSVLAGETHPLARQGPAPGVLGVRG
jgi:integrase